MKRACVFHPDAVDHFSGECVLNPLNVKNGGVVDDPVKTAAEEKVNQEKLARLREVAKVERAFVGEGVCPTCGRKLMTEERRAYMREYMRKRRREKK